MKTLISAVIAVFLGCVPLAAQTGQNPPSQQGVQPLASNANSAQTLGKVGKTNYAWINGRAWLSLDDNAKIALVAGIEQGIVLGVRENWDAVPKNAQQDLVDTAARLTVSHATFTQLAVDIDSLYLQRSNLDIPVVDAYEYALLKIKNVPKKQLERFLDRLRQDYQLQEPGKKR